MSIRLSLPSLQHSTLGIRIPRLGLAFFRKLDSAHQFRCSSFCIGQHDIVRPCFVFVPNPKHQSRLYHPSQPPPNEIYRKEIKLLLIVMTQNWSTSSMKTSSVIIITIVGAREVCRCGRDLTPAVCAPTFGFPRCLSVCLAHSKNVWILLVFAQFKRPCPSWPPIVWYFQRLPLRCPNDFKTKNRKGVLVL